MSNVTLTSRARAVIRSLCAAAIATAVAFPATASAQIVIPGVGTHSLGGEADRTPVGEVDPARYLPTPSPDPWYSHPPEVDESIAPGTILATRDAHIPWYNGAVGVDRAWQMLIRTTDSHGAPTSTVSTVMIPSVEWNGPGPRPLLSFAVAIDGLGMECQPSYSKTQDFSIEFPPIMQVLVARGYGLVVTDHQGPKAAYGASRMGGHALLDGIRAARAFGPAGLGDSPAAIYGYSGGGIAAGGAAQVQAEYAPETADYLVANAVGGAPIDLDTAFDTLDGTVGAGLFRSAVIGIAREYPELYTLLGRTGDRVFHELRDECAAYNTVAGLDQTRLADLSWSPDLRREPLVQAVFDHNRLGPDPSRPDEIPQSPVALFWPDRSFGIGDQFFPDAQAEVLRRQWCEKGASVDYIPIAGGHVLGQWTAVGPVLDWIDRRLAGQAWDGCAVEPGYGPLGSLE